MQIIIWRLCFSRYTSIFFVVVKYFNMKRETSKDFKWNSSLIKDIEI